MQKKMGLGINLGNTLEAPVEGAWAPKATQQDFDQYKQKGFTNIRIPLRWDNHTQVAPPYRIDEQFMARVEQVVGWSLQRGFVTVINTHHDDWLDNQANFAAQLPRFKAIWTQIAARFQGKPETLLFEVYNEPHIMSVDQLNKMNAAALPIIRKNNPNRIVILGGLQWMNPNWQVQHPAAMTIPRGDPQLMLEIHNYDPAPYALVKEPTVHSWGSAVDIAALNKWMDDIAAWSKSHHLPIYYGEVILDAEPDLAVSVLLSSPDLFHLPAPY
jgi:endoglucanase